MKVLRARGVPLLLASAVLMAFPPVAAAQSGGRGPAVLSRGEGEEREAPGAYASPSGIPEAPVDEKFGIPHLGGRSHDPIALPNGTGSGISPQVSLPGLPSFAPQMLPSLDIIRPEKALILNARLEEDGELIPSGLVWRLFSPIPLPDGRLQLVGVSKGGEAVFDVPAGSYLMHVGYGRAGMTRRIEFSGERTREVVTIEAGGLRLGATAADGVSVDSESLTFDIFSAETADADRRLIAEDVPADVVIRLNSGLYHVVSNYGEANAVVRADVKVETGRITEAQLKHHAAELTLKLVREEGGEALADTAWSIASAQGDIIAESVGAFSSVVLAEGDYVVVAKNRDRIYQRELAVEAGRNAEIEMLSTELAVVEGPQTGSGD